MELVLPALRADAALYRRYVYCGEPPLRIPIYAYGGRADPNIPVEQVEAWREQTTARFARREFEGGHFFIKPSRDAFLAALASDLWAVLLNK